MFANLDAVREANRRIGHKFFDDEAMLFFKTRIATGIIGGRFFITSEVPPNGKRKYTVREILPSGEVITCGEFHRFSTVESAKNWLRRSADER